METRRNAYNFALTADSTDEIKEELFELHDYSGDDERELAERASPWLLKRMQFSKDFDSYWRVERMPSTTRHTLVQLPATLLSLHFAILDSFEFDEGMWPGLELLLAIAMDLNPNFAAVLESAVAEDRCLSFTTDLDALDLGGADDFDVGVYALREPSDRTETGFTATIGSRARPRAKPISNAQAASELGDTEQRVPERTKHVLWSLTNIRSRRQRVWLSRALKFLAIAVFDGTTVGLNANLVDRDIRCAGLSLGELQIFWEAHCDACAAGLVIPPLQQDDSSEDSYQSFYDTHIEPKTGLELGAQGAYNLFHSMVPLAATDRFPLFRAIPLSGIQCPPCARRAPASFRFPSDPQPRPRRARRELVVDDEPSEDEVDFEPEPTIEDLSSSTLSTGSEWNGPLNVPWLEGVTFGRPRNLVPDVPAPENLVRHVPAPDVSLPSSSHRPMVTFHVPEEKKMRYHLKMKREREEQQRQQEQEREQEP